MNFDEIVTEVMARTRQTSDEAKTRIGRAVNDRHRRVTSSLGLNTARRITQTAIFPDTSNDMALTLTTTKVYALFQVDPVRRLLGEISFDEWRHLDVHHPVVGLPQWWAVDAVPKTSSGNALVVRLHPKPDPNDPNAAAYEFGADVLENQQDLVTGVVGSTPRFSPDFHDIIVHGALADEWMALKQDDLSKRSEATYEQRLAELRMFIAKSAYLDIHQGKHSPYPGGFPWGYGGY